MISNDYDGGPGCGSVKSMGLFSAISGCFFPCGHPAYNETPSKQCFSNSNVHLTLLGTLLKCRFGFTRSGAGTEILSFQDIPK